VQDTVNLFFFLNAAVITPGSWTLTDGVNSIIRRRMRTITLEEHYATPGFLEGPGREFLDRAAAAGRRMTRILSQLSDLDTGRIVEMDVSRRCWIR
jgi:hypothetical protein